MTNAVGSNPFSCINDPDQNRLVPSLIWLMVQDNAKILSGGHQFAVSPHIYRAGGICRAHPRVWEKLTNPQNVPTPWGA